MNITLQQVEKLYNQMDLLQLQKNLLIDKVMTPELKSQLNDIDEEFEPVIEQIKKTFKILEEQVKKEVVEQGSTISGSISNFKKLSETRRAFCQFNAEKQKVKFG